MKSIDPQILERAKRVRKIRKDFFQVTQPEFAEMLGVHKQTLKFWDSAHFTGLSEKGARKIIALMKTKNIECSLDWLMHGYGIGPSTVTVETSKEADSINKEMIEFEKHNPNSVVFKLTDISMTPPYRQGDFIAGVNKSPQTCVNKHCIVTLSDNSTVFRHVSKVETKENKILANLHCLNFDYDDNDAKLIGVEVLNMAPIIRYYPIRGEINDYPLP